MYTTAHTWEENIPLQLSAVGDHMKVLRALTMPGQDCLGRKALQVHDFKEIVSVAEFHNTRASTELLGAGAFGMAGNGAGHAKPWSTFNPVFLKQAINSVTAWGVSHIIPHGVFTTRKLTGNPWPPDWYAENPMFPYMHLWTDFARRASYINSMGCAVPDVLLYNPLESAWISTDATMLDDKIWDILEGRNDGSRVHQLDKVYATAINGMNDPKMIELMATLKAAPTFTALTDGLKAQLESDIEPARPGLEPPFRCCFRNEFQMLQQHRADRWEGILLAG